jgi:NTP pyrophosphatase (non-canonical NTP hydrolase)
MKTEQFEDLVIEHSLCPGKKLYNATALAGEVGEVCNNLKKMHMANMNPEWVTQEKNPLLTAEHFREKLIDELGDALFYLTRVAIDNGTDLRRLMMRQEAKLSEQCDKYERIFLK